MVRRTVLALSCLSAVVLAQAAPDDDRRAVEDVVRRAYVDGVHTRPSVAAMRQGFHPEFRMYVLEDGAVSVVTLEEWAARLEKATAARTTAPDVKAEFTRIHVTGDVAVAQLQIHRDGRHVFTDVLSLYRTADGWRIVAKVFRRH